MIDFLKDRILLFVLIIAGDWVSLSSLIKAGEIRHDAITIAIAVSLLPSLVISLLVEFFFRQRLAKTRLISSAAILSLVFWAGFIFFYGRFTSINNQYGKISFPVEAESFNGKDSVIVGGCSYTAEAQAEVDTYASKKRTLTPAMLFADFNYDVSQIWTEKERDCARGKILNAFAIMLAFLIAGITLTCETLIAYKKKK
jgi:hypothetical protein